MGLLDDAMGMLGGGKGGGSSQIMGALGGLVASAGGMEGIMSKLEASGMGDKLQSWIGTGQNQEMSAAEVEQALGKEEIQKAAAEAGVSEQEAADGLAGLLPQVIDKISPDGKLPDMGQLDEMMGSFLKK
jgi:uncharacterized protein YidB (DUF937 family)